MTEFEVILDPSGQLPAASAKDLRALLGRITHNRQSPLKALIPATPHGDLVKSVLSDPIEDSSKDPTKDPPLRRLDLDCGPSGLTLPVYGSLLLHRLLQDPETMNQVRVITATLQNQIYFVTGLVLKLDVSKDEPQASSVSASRSMRWGAVPSFSPEEDSTGIEASMAVGEHPVLHNEIVKSSSLPSNIDDKSNSQGSPTAPGVETLNGSANVQNTTASPTLPLRLPPADHSLDMSKADLQMDIVTAENPTVAPSPLSLPPPTPRPAATSNFLPTSTAGSQSGTILPGDVETHATSPLPEYETVEDDDLDLKSSAHAISVPSNTKRVQAELFVVQKVVLRPISVRTVLLGSVANRENVGYGQTRKRQPIRVSKYGPVPRDPAARPYYVAADYSLD